MTKECLIWTLVFLHPALALAQDASTALGADAGEPAEVASATPPQSAPPTEPQSADATQEGTPLSASELEALGFGTVASNGEVSTVDTDLHVSGFIDFGVSTLIAKKSSLIRGFLPNNTNFFVGNFNVYLTKNISETFRTMGEVRVLFKPNGDIPLSSGVGTPTTTTKDPADFDRPLHWGGVEIERVYLEWGPHSLVNVRAGQFLTPYGIWNVDHGSPTFIPVQRPYVVGESLFPERQTGFEVFGSWDATSQGTLGYHVTLSNGEGPISEYRDLDDNKAIGGRLFWEQQGFGTLRVGGSAYYGRDTDAVSSVAVTAEGKLGPAEKIYRQADVLSLAVDAVWKYRGLLVQAEWISRQQAYTNGGRAAITSNYVSGKVFPADTLSWGVYGLLGYRLPWYGIMPYFVGQYLDHTQNIVRSQTTNLQFGLNIRPLDALVFKIEYAHAFFADKLFGSSDPIRFFQAQAAWAF